MKKGRAISDAVLTAIEIQKDLTVVELSIDQDTSK